MDEIVCLLAHQMGTEGTLDLALAADTIFIDLHHQPEEAAAVIAGEAKEMLAACLTRATWYFCDLQHCERVHQEIRCLLRCQL